MHSLNKFKSVFVLGGTSEIAHELCIELVKSGTKKIHLVSRQPDKNKFFIENIIRNFNVEISDEKFDLLDFDLQVMPNIEFFDLYIIAAGYLGDSDLANNDQDEALKIARINYYALIPWINAIISKNRIFKPGSLWVLSSVAGDIGRPSNYHYGAAKAALTIFCEGILNKCQDKPFKVRIIKAGLIKTKMSFGKGPAILYANKKFMARKLIKKQNKIGIEYFPWWWRFIIILISILPRSIISKL